MKIEKRGKYPGVKVHLEKDECEVLLALAANYEIAYPKGSPILDGGSHNYISLSAKMGRKIKLLLAEEPNLLTERTEEEVIAALSKESIESAEKLAAIGKGVDWTKVKVEVLK
jgi:hypothetical protein